MDPSFKWKGRLKPAVCPSCSILSHTQMTSHAFWRFITIRSVAETFVKFRDGDGIPSSPQTKNLTGRQFQRDPLVGYPGRGQKGVSHESLAFGKGSAIPT